MRDCEVFLVFRASPPPFCFSNSAETLPKSAAEFCSAFWRAGKKNHLKGDSHEIEMGQIWYQKKDLEKLELHGYILAVTKACARRYERF